MRCSIGDQEKMKILVYLIRHGKTEGNLKKAYIGVTDQPLCLEGRAELERLAGCFPLPDEVWHSPLCRCAQTAEILYPGFQQMFVKICGNAILVNMKGKPTIS